MTQYPDDQLITQYLKLEAVLASREKERETADKPYKDGMNTIKNALQARLVERGAQNTKTDAGTAYLSDILNVKVVDQEAFLQTNDSIGFTVHPTKDDVKKYMQDHKGEMPPGITTSVFVKLNIRRS